MNDSTMYDDNDPVILAMAYAECQEAARDILSNDDDLVLTLLQTPQSESARFCSAAGL